MINNYIKNACLIVFALIGPISLPAGGIQRSITDILDAEKNNEIVLSSNTYIYNSPEKNSIKLRALRLGTSASILRYWISSEDEKWVRVELSKSIFTNNLIEPLKGWIKV
tara:strand:+ start:365 stop:694 length:330 start_codon:yes stop_codon:yes gene_type:complete